MCWALKTDLAPLSKPRNEAKRRLSPSVKLCILTISNTVYLYSIHGLQNSNAIVFIQEDVGPVSLRLP